MIRSVGLQALGRTSVLLVSEDQALTGVTQRVSCSRARLLQMPCRMRGLDLNCVQVPH